MKWYIFIIIFWIISILLDIALIIIFLIRYNYILFLLAVVHLYLAWKLATRALIGMKSNIKKLAKKSPEILEWLKEKDRIMLEKTLIETQKDKPLSHKHARRMFWIVVLLYIAMIIFGLYTKGIIG